MIVRTSGKAGGKKRLSLIHPAREMNKAIDLTESDDQPRKRRMLGTRRYIVKATKRQKIEEHPYPNTYLAWLPLDIYHIIFDMAEKSYHKGRVDMLSNNRLVYVANFNAAYLTPQILSSDGVHGSGCMHVVQVASNSRMKAAALKEHKEHMLEADLRWLDNMLAITPLVDDGNHRAVEDWEKKSNYYMHSTGLLCSLNK